MTIKIHQLPAGQEAKAIVVVEVRRAPLAAEENRRVRVA